MPTELSKLLLKASKERGLTYASLAKASRLSTSAVGSALSGSRTPKLNNLNKLIQAMNIGGEEEQRIRKAYVAPQPGRPKKPIALDEERTGERLDFWLAVGNELKKTKLLFGGDVRGSLTSFDYLVVTDRGNIALLCVHGFYSAWSDCVDVCSELADWETLGEPNKVEEMVIVVPYLRNMPQADSYREEKRVRLVPLQDLREFCLGNDSLGV